ncbi:glycosyltransferase [Pseudorhodoferax sp.]|uniref:glycosyltransferase n=1 Tax=Pseudorhodoferax sp. TaxID=1993553 RepID=UPI002DD66F9A|nr:glycosyltransferase [Pseudorhodoferax sp.]
MTAVHPSPGPRRVIVHRSDALPYSETFIKEQMQACRRWQPVLVGTQCVAGGLPLDGLPAAYLRAPDPGRAALLQWKLCRELGLPAPGALARLRAQQASLVHVHFATDAVALWPSLQRLGLPVLVTLHGYDINVHRQWWEQGHGGRIGRRYPGRLLQMGQSPQVRFVAVSQAVRETAVRYGLDPHKVHVHYIGVDVQRFQPAGPGAGARAPRILFVGRMVEKKGAHHLIHAFAALRRQLPDAQLAMVGDGPLLASYQALARELGVPVEFLGRQGADAVRAEFARARVFCLPSVTAADGDAEGLPIVIMEAQAMGVPVVTSARGGATEGIVDGESGIAFAEGDVPALTQALARVLADAPLAERMGRRARRFAELRFDIGACTAGLEVRYDECVQAASRQGQPATRAWA